MRTLSSKIKSPSALKRLLAKKSRKKLVFTNGCFDLLHKGHVAYLERARKLGDILVVALNSDQSVRQLKGKGRPLNPLADRLEVIAALESVDFVTWFATETPLTLIRLLKPDVLVKGGDWRPEQIVGASDVLSAGGTVKSLPYIAGRSTTRLIAKARQ
jgi:rfaE bifunctional protein nucleotidyltransferase chain/domain